MLLATIANYYTVSTKNYNPVLYVAIILANNLGF